MPYSSADQDRTVSDGRLAAALTTVSGALLLLLAFATAALLTAEVFVRIGSRTSLLGPDSFDRVMGYLGLGFAAAALPALPAALAAPFARAGDPPLRSHSALALVPGCLLAAAIWLAALVATIATAPMVEVGMKIAMQRSSAAFENFVFLLLPLTIALAAVLGGPRTPESAAAAGAPVVLVAVSGMLGELSIAQLFLSVLLPLLAAAVVLASLYAAAPVRAVTPWLAGIALAFGMTLLVATGLFTPTEAIGLIALFGLPIALLLRTFALGQPLGAMLRHMAMETVSVAAALAAGVLATAALLLAGVDPTLGGTGLSPAVLAAGGAVFLAASYLLTPVLVFALALPFLLAALRVPGIEPVLSAAVLILLGLAAAIARAGRREPAGAGLTPLAAGIGAATFVVVAALAAFVPEFALTPVRALLQ